MIRGFAYGSPYTLTPGLPSPGLDYLPASHHRLSTTSWVRAFHERRLGRYSLQTLSTSRFDMGALKRVREYQPVVHRLRLSASP